jgi:hypothetical protein
VTASASPSRRLRSLLLLALCGLAVGCIQFHSTVKVNRDGSGGVVQELVISGTLMAMFGGEFDLADEAQLRNDASAMGPGVTLASVEAIDDARGRGHRAVYRFTDIDQLTLNQNPSGSMPQAAGGGDAVQENVRFALRRGTPARLRVDLPQPEGGDVGEAAPGELPAGEMLDLARQLYSEMKMSLAIEVDGAIRSSTATHVDGARVTVMEIDFGDVVADEGRFLELLSQNPDTLSSTLSALAEIEGIKVETQPSFEIVSISGRRRDQALPLRLMRK